jgi:hypothetical protein
VGASLRLIMVPVVATALLLASCGGDTRETDDASATAAVSLCTSWADMKSVVETDEVVDESALTVYLDARDGASVPDELVDEWDAIVAWDDQMIEVLHAVDFQPDDITEMMMIGAFGSVDQAESAAVDQEAAFEAVDRWALLNCGEGVADSLAFCELWTDIYLSLSGFSRHMDGPERDDPEQNQRVELRAQQRELTNVIAQANGVVPPEIADDWNSFADYHLARYDVLVTVEFDEDLISDDLVSDAFGSPEAAAEATDAAEAAVEVIEEWSQTGCGDFCVRSAGAPDLLFEFGDGHYRYEGPDGPWALANNLRELEAVTVLMPDELLVVWSLATAEAADWWALWERYGFDLDWTDQPEAMERALEVFRGAEYILIDLEQDPDRYPDTSVEIESIIEAWRSGAELPDYLLEQIVDLLRRPPAERSVWDRALQEIAEWYGRNCDRAGGPGVVEVEFAEITGAAGDRLVLAVGPLGSTFADFDNVAQFELGMCNSIDRDPWGIEAQEEGRRLVPWVWRLASRVEEAGDVLCGFHGGGDPIDAGAYTLVVAQYEGSVEGDGRWPEPTHCLAIDITISGDTYVRIPGIPPCDVTQTEFGPDDWRYSELVSASEPGAGTLKVRLPDHRIPPEISTMGGQVEFKAVVLPAGTTINEVGREQVFPTGAGCVRLVPENEVPEQLGSRPVEVPIGSLPPVGLPGCLDPFWLNGLQPIAGDSRPGLPPDDSKLPLTVLAAGAYDVRAWVFHEGDESKKVCATFEVEISGDTIVDVPELEDCS